MKTLATTTLLGVAAIGFLASAHRAQAVATLGFDQNNDNVIDFIVSDGGAPTVYNLGQPGIPVTTLGDLSPVAGQVNAIISTGSGVFDINTGITKPQLGSASAPVLTLSIDITGVPPGTYALYFSETFFGPSPSNFFADLTLNPAPGSVGTSVSYTSYASASNQLFQPFGVSSVFGIAGAPATLITNQSFATGVGGFEATTGSAGATTSAAYSLTQVLKITVAPGSVGTFTATANLNTRVPDGGSTVALLGLSMLGLHGIRRKFAKR